jgi:hypothetical protein
MKIMKTKVALTGLILLAIVGGGFALTRLHHASANTNTPGLKDVNLNPPTQQDKTAVDQHKEDLSNNSSTTPTVSNGKQVVTPVIADASQYGDAVEVRSYVASIIENGGTCQITFVHGNTTVTKQVNGLKDATTTRCTNLSVSRSEFSTAGNWSVTVTYNSTTATGSSETKIVSIQ